MYYSNIKSGKFINRLNRFLANIEIDGKIELCHVKNTGRCEELLIQGCNVYVQEQSSSKRKTKFSLIAVQKGNVLVNMDSQAPNKVVQEWLKEKEPFGNIMYLKSECKYGNSRFDFYLELDNDKMYIEVKGVTLEKDKIVMFPDAPTERGVKHIRELIKCTQDGYRAAVIFVVQLEGAKYFTPNAKTQPEFAEALRDAQLAGVKILAVECKVTNNQLIITKDILVKL